MSSSVPAPWTVATRRRPCPICDGVGCLLSSSASPDAVVCLFEESPHPVGQLGWLHELRPCPAWTKWRLSLARLIKEESR